MSREGNFVYHSLACSDTKGSLHCIMGKSSNINFLKQLDQYWKNSNDISSDLTPFEASVVKKCQYFKWKWVIKFGNHGKQIAPQTWNKNLVSYSNTKSRILIPVFSIATVAVILKNFRTSSLQPLGWFWAKAITNICEIGEQELVFKPLGWFWASLTSLRKRNKSCTSWLILSKNHL